MSHHCHGSCSHEGQPQSSGGSCCPCHNCKCGCHTCKCECHARKGKYADELLALADQAWMEVLKEKIKKEIESHSGEHLNQTAKLVAEANHTRWKEKLQARKDSQDFEDRLRNLIFTGKKS